jgi:ABC-type uncharacterized transport system ATPase subunit
LVDQSLSGYPRERENLLGYQCSGRCDLAGEKREIFRPKTAVFDNVGMHHRHFDLVLNNTECFANTAVNLEVFK